jgi:hypothetical protein
MSLEVNTNNHEINIDHNAFVNYSFVESLLANMAANPTLLKDGYKALSGYEKHFNFYLNFMRVIFESECSEKVKKLACSSLKIFLSKNWSDESYIRAEEKMVKI